MAIEFCTIPEECRAQIFFVEGGYTGVDWQAEVHATGAVILVDKEGNRYETPEALQRAGVERFTLINHHVVWVQTPEPDIDDGIHDGRDFDEPYATETEDRIYGI